LPSRTFRTVFTDNQHVVPNSEKVDEVTAFITTTS